MKLVLKILLHFKIAKQQKWLFLSALSTIVTICIFLSLTLQRSCHSEITG